MHRPHPNRGAAFFVGSTRTRRLAHWGALAIEYTAEKLAVGCVLLSLFAGCAGEGANTDVTATSTGTTEASSAEPSSGGGASAVAEGSGGGTSSADASSETTGGDAGEPAPQASRCEVTETTITCTHQTLTLFTGLGDAVPREVHWQTPLGDPPAAGWPAVFVFQGSLFTAELFWTVIDTEAFGYWNQGLLTKALLDAGFVVITPEARFDGNTAWETNIPPMSAAWELSNDHDFMLDIFDAIETGTMGEVDVSRLYATGISSGGYMSSRMDQAYRSRFRALAIHSASYATCGGAACIVPPSLDAAHRPTLFLHGGADLIVPQWTMELYADALVGLGVETQTIVAPSVGHAWLDEAPSAIVAWFQDH
ncbi:MAG: dienelactone hydrolase family protein [bacterium]|nr:dienelactone hydrolase family protein [bacterium]